jgi:hypothetical protein
MRTILLVTVFLSGAVLMSLEMVSFRLVEPVYGSAMIVWGSLISVFLGGLALGAVGGGALADRGPRLWKLAALIVVGGAITLALPYWSGKAVLEYLYPTFDMTAAIQAARAAAPSPETLVQVQPPDLRWPTLMACLIIFGPPTLLLGMVSPYGARLYIQNMPSMGADVGRLYGISTVGSIAGTLITAFYLIGELGTEDLLLANGLALVEVGVVLVLAELLGLTRIGLIVGTFGAAIYGVAGWRTGDVLAWVHTYDPLQICGFAQLSLGVVAVLIILVTAKRGRPAQA